MKLSKSAKSILKSRLNIKPKTLLLIPLVIFTAYFIVGNLFWSFRGLTIHAQNEGFPPRNIYVDCFLVNYIEVFAAFFSSIMVIVLAFVLALKERVTCEK